MKIDFDGRMWDLDILDIPVGQCEAVEKYVPAKGMGDWYNQLDAGNTKAVIALWWVLRKQAGEETGPISQPGDGFRPVRLLFAFNAAGRAEAAAEAEAAEAAELAAEQDPGPTPPRTPARGSRAKPPGTATAAGTGGGGEPHLPG